MKRTIRSAARSFRFWKRCLVDPSMKAVEFAVELLRILDGSLLSIKP